MVVLRWSLDTFKVGKAPEETPFKRTSTLNLSVNWQYPDAKISLRIDSRTGISTYKYTYLYDLNSSLKRFSTC